MPLPTGRRATVLQAVLTGGAKHDGSQSTSAGHLMAPGADGAGARGAVSGVAPKTPQRPGAASGTVSNPVSPQQNPDPDMERQRLEFERQVTDPALLDSDDDPLEIHYRYVRWLLEHYTTGHNASSRTLNVLERTLETFKRDGRCGFCCATSAFDASKTDFDRLPPAFEQIQERPETFATVAHLQRHGPRSSRCLPMAPYQRHFARTGGILRRLGRLPGKQRTVGLLCRQPGLATSSSSPLI